MSQKIPKPEAIGDPHCEQHFLSVILMIWFGSDSKKYENLGVYE